MKQQHAPISGRDILERGCRLAEARLDYLTELFESGRWRRFHTETDFLDNIREAKSAVETWRRLTYSEASADNRTVNRSWLDRPGASTVASHRGAVLHEASHHLVPQLAERAPQIVPVAAESDWRDSLDPAVVQNRYPILRNAM